MANKTARLGDLATYINGYAFKPADWGDTGLPIIRIQDLTGNSYQLNRYDGEYPERIEVNDGDVLISWSASLGVYVWQRGKALLNQHIFKVVFDKLPINKDYFVFAVEHKLADMESKTHGATMKHIVKKDFDGTTIPYPTSEKQAEIADHLRRITSIIDRQTEQLLLLDQLVKSRFIELFGDPVLNQHGWRKVALEVNATLLNGRAYKQDELLDSGKYPVLRVGNFFSNRGWYYSDLELDDDKYCDNGDLLYAWSASFGPQIWNGGKVIYHYHIWKVLVGEAYNKQFLCKLLEYATESLMGDTHGIAMMHLTKSGMEKTEFIVPPIERQEQFAAFVEQTDKSKLAVQKGLQELEILKKSLMQQYFG